jgi:glucose-6-phosphate isomerase
MMQLTENPHFDQICRLARTHRRLHLSGLVKDADRAHQLVFEHDGLGLDLTRQILQPDALAALIKMASAAGVEAWRDRILAGDRVNITEGRQVTHHALRQPSRFDTAEWAALAAFAETVRASGQFDRIVNIGIGGSDLGPAMVAGALHPFNDGPHLAFVSNLDPAHLHDVLMESNPHRTAFIITSKTFTTPDTLANAALARDWMRDAGADWHKAVAAVTAASKKAVDWGVPADRIFAFDEGVGGRYSLWSAVGLPVICGVGVDHFKSFLNGAHAVDRHFAEAPLQINLPVLMALMRVWNRNFLGFPAHGIMPYDQRLARFPAWAQQLEMESNGKRVTRDGTPLSQPASPLIWGEPGTNAQHSFFQYLHQGVDIVPIDILIPLAPMLGDIISPTWRASHSKLVANAVAQAESLAIGDVNLAEPHRHFPGNRPSSLISWPKSSPYHIGQITALYENVTIASGILWGLNSFDQFGVELGKKLASLLESEEPDNRISPTAIALVAKSRNENR